MSWRAPDPVTLEVVRHSLYAIAEEMSVIVMRSAPSPLLKEAGVDIFSTCTPPPVGDFDLAEAKRAVGDRICLKGYVDLLYVVKMGTPELIERTVAEAMEIGKPGGGFILGSSDSFRDGTPVENIRAYFDAARRYGRYGR